MVIVISTQLAVLGLVEKRAQSREAANDDAKGELNNFPNEKVEYNMCGIFSTGSFRGINSAKDASCACTVGFAFSFEGSVDMKEYIQET